MPLQLNRAYRRLLHSLDNYGVAGTLRRGLGQGQGPEISPSWPESPHPFDVEHGTDTGGYVPGEEIQSGSRADLYNTAYYGISPSTLIHALSLIEFPPGTTFVDLGCGKGRALLVAAGFPFAALLGVELSAALGAIAHANAAQVGLTNVTVLAQDASTMKYPETPLVVYLYHPFLMPVRRRVLANLERQRNGCAHPTWLLDANPQGARMMARRGRLHKVWEYLFQLSPEDAAADRHGTTGERYALYEYRSEPGAARGKS